MVVEIALVHCGRFTDATKVGDELVPLAERIGNYPALYVHGRARASLEFWRDGDFYVGRLLEVPGVFSQGETLEELQENIQDAYDLMVTRERSPAPVRAGQGIAALRGG